MFLISSFFNVVSFETKILLLVIAYKHFLNALNLFNFVA